MRMVFGLVLLLGLGLAGFAVYMAKGYFSTYQAEAQRLQAIADSRVETVNVFVVQRKAAYGSQLTKDDVKLIKWPVSSLPEGIFTFPAQETEEGEPGEELFPKDRNELRAVKRTMEVGEPVLMVKVTEPGGSVGIQSQVSAGMSAFPIKVDVASGAGFFRPDDIVDVYWTGKPPGQNSGTLTRLIQSNAKLIGVNGSTNNDLEIGTIARTVTFEATPQQVAALTQARNTGKISLSLVGMGGVEIADGDAATIEIDQQTLLGIEEVAAPEEEVEKRICYRKERKGTEIITTDVVVDCPN